MIIAVPKQKTVLASGIGIPEYATVLTWYSWWCSVCRVSASNAASSHAAGALDQARWHLQTVQCHVEGQLSLLPVLDGARCTFEKSVVW